MSQEDRTMTKRETTVTTVWHSVICPSGHEYDQRGNDAPSQCGTCGRTDIDVYRYLEMED